MSKILLIEDDGSMSRVYERAFRFEKYEVILAKTGLEGLKKLKIDKPDIILLDLMMPEMSGIEFLDRVKKDDKIKDIPVIVLTNLAGENDASFALSKGAIKYLIKSQQKPQDVVRIVNDILKEK